MRIVAHELRSPLQSLLMMADVCRQDPEGEMLASMPDRVSRQAERMVRVIDDLSDAGQIEAGQLRIEPVPVDLVAVVREAVEPLRDATPDHAIELEGPERLPIRADAPRISQVITNFVTNAIKYSPAGSTVHVRVDGDGSEARVSVRDEGQGIDPAMQRQVFERYFRTRAAQSSADGLGLGLFIAKHIVSAHAGRIGVDSTPGQGSTFWFTLPIAGISSGNAL